MIYQTCPSSSLSSSSSSASGSIFFIGYKIYHISVLILHDVRNQRLTLLLFNLILFLEILEMVKKNFLIDAVFNKSISSTFELL